MINQKNIDKALAKAKLLKEVLEKIKEANASTAASIDREIGFISKWMEGLNSGSDERLNAVWQEVQPISKMMDNIYEPKQLSTKKDKLINEFWEAMRDVAVDLRRN